MTIDDDTVKRAYDAFRKAERESDPNEIYLTTMLNSMRAALEVASAARSEGTLAASLGEDARDAIRAAFADYVYSEGCSCCRGEDHEAHAEVLAKLLDVKPYSDGSGYDFTAYRADAALAQPSAGDAP